MGERKNGDAVEKFIQFIRCDELTGCNDFWEVIADYPLAFVLMSVIAQRAKRTLRHKIQSLEIGEAMIGDYRNYGMSHQQYRTALNKLVKWKFITIKVTNKGTIAKISDTRLYDINPQTDSQTKSQATHKQVTSNSQLTKNDNNERMKEEKDKYSCSEPEEEPASAPVFIELPLNDNSVYQIKKSVLDEMQLLYPAVSIENEFRKMRGWLLTNPTRRKTKRGIKKFYNAWLSKEQDRWHKEDKITMSKNDTPSNKQEISPYVCKKCGQGIMYCTCEN